MNINRVREKVRNGFKPFALRLSDGRRVHVPYPDAIAFGPGVVVVVAKTGAVSILDPLHIVSLEEPKRHS
jgi:hypothetical protein